MKVTRTTLLAGAMLLASAASAAQPAPDGPPREETRADAVARADQLFGRLDGNHDGRITADEVRSATSGPSGPGGPPPPGAGPGAPGGPGGLFDRLDVDHDGSLSREEFARMGPPPGGAGMGMGMGMGMGRGAGGGEMLARMMGPDGLTQEAFRARMLQRFDRLDADHDGRITAAEREQARARMQQMRGAAGPMGRPDGDGEQ